MLFSVPVRGEFTIARVLQYGSHVFASLAFVYLVYKIARESHLERW